MFSNKKKRSNTRSRAQAVFVRRRNEVGPMSWDMRLRNRFKSTFDFHREYVLEDTSEEFMAVIGSKGDDGRDRKIKTAAVHEKPKPKQYRLEATNRNASKGSWFKYIFTCGVASYIPSVGVNPNQRLAMSLHWMFRVNFFFLFIVMCVTFFVLVIIFTFIIIIAGEWQPECVRIGDQPFTDSDTAFANGFALSWVTFSTVGYGNLYPARGFEANNPTNCFFINFIASLEALVGVLYSGFCGAILFGKVLRIQSHAQVIFSDPIVIRYGPGALENEDDAFHNHHSNDPEKGGGSPCPILEFRIVNRLYDEVGGEIMDATLNVVANVDAADVNSENVTGSEYTTPIIDSIRDSASNEDSLSDSGSDSMHGKNKSNHKKSRRNQRSRQHSLDRLLFPFRSMSHHHKNNQQQIIEDTSERISSKQIFSKMKIEATEHPFFKRVWLARHYLNQHSPLIKPRVRRQIKRNNGKWPDRLNNYQAIHDSLQFNQILVSLKGVSNVSACSCYAQRIYDFVDVNIGYQFVNMLFRDYDNTLGIDIDLINDVKEQNGGGGEPLIVE